MHIQQGDATLAEAQLRACISANPENAVATVMLGAALDMQGKKAEAVEMAEKAMALAPENQEVAGNYRIIVGADV